MAKANEPRGPRVPWWGYPAAFFVVLLRGGDAADRIFEHWSRRTDPNWWAEYDALLRELESE